MEPNTISILIIAFAINLVIFYFLIKAAVRSANNELKDKLDLMVKLKTLEMKMAGNEEAVDTLLKLTQLEKEMDKGYLSEEEYDKKKKQILVD